ncbi:hypothetical protein LTR36_009820 [Oleoguttula mirabilis]|uniref:EKC/KEOPS complex subunit CGI121 n=1 Tax=Oleoguttula mirabilis TaxID=1507867 RepID=A0AAV9J5H1_9PEZI|nr:hypothetical protein LTR36_009820 [Oleoguttula mirabilis]
METVSLPHLPDYPLHICLFKDVNNAPFLRQQLLEGNTDFEYAFLDASILLSRNQVLAACFRAINDLLQDRLKSRNVHSEIVFSLSPNNNISESFRRFGVAETSRHILAVKVGGVQSQIEQHLKGSVEGNLVPLTDEQFAELRDESRLRKVYKIGATGNEAEAFVIGSMALKGS